MESSESRGADGDTTASNELQRELMEREHEVVDSLGLSTSPTIRQAFGSEVRHR